MTQISDDIYVWRYMNLPKFIDLLYKEKLYFCNVKYLKDLYECTFDELKGDESELSKFKDLIYVNCWSISPVEDYALWKVYLENNTSGVAIRSTPKRIVDSLDNDDPFYSSVLQIDQVNYSHTLDEINIKAIVCTKKPFYSYEKELRLWLRAVYEHQKGLPGIEVSVNLDTLIESIYISPFTPEWFYLALNDFIYKYKGEVFLQSKLIPSSIREQQ